MSGLFFCGYDTWKLRTPKEYDPSEIDEAVERDRNILTRSDDTGPWESVECGSCHGTAIEECPWCHVMYCGRHLENHECKGGK